MKYPRGSKGKTDAKKLEFEAHSRLFVAVNREISYCCVMVILYVDDDPEDIEIFEEAVKEADSSAKCLIAKNGKRAMDILQGELIPDFIFLDINMPVINGKSILLEIRKDKKFKGIPVVMYSTTMNSMEIEEYEKMGANHFLTKHNTFQDLCDELSRILNSKLSGR